MAHALPFDPVQKRLDTMSVISVRLSGCIRIIDHAPGVTQESIPQESHQLGGPFPASLDGQNQSNPAAIRPVLQETEQLIDVIGSCGTEQIIRAIFEHLERATIGVSFLV
jgi:hypothetical protein